MKDMIPRTNADEYCRKFKPDDKPLYIHDSQVKGLVFRIMPTGSKSWILRYLENMKPMNRKRIEKIEKACSLEEGKSSYALVVYSPEIHDQIDSLEIDADFVVALPYNGRGDLMEEVPQGGYKVFYG